jgi:hypothetical protein
MKYQLNVQKELNEKTEEDKNHKIKIENLSTKLKTTIEKKTRLQSQIEEQRIKIEKLILSKAQGENYKEHEFKKLVPEATENWRDFGKSIEGEGYDESRRASQLNTPRSTLKNGHKSPHILSGETDKRVKLTKNQSNQNSVK